MQLKTDEVMHRSTPAGSSQLATSQSSTALQLGASHILASLVALALFFWLDRLHLSQPYPLLLALAAACLIGLLATGNLQYTLYMLELALTRFARGQSLERANDHDTKNLFSRRWPLSSLFLRLQEANQRIERYAQSEQLTTDLRAKALQQASEAAAQAERNRIARELHDSIKQQIFSISVSAAAAQALWKSADAGEAQDVVADIQQSAKEAQVEMQALLQEMRPAPLENTSLVDALRVQAQALGFRTGAQVQVEIAEMPGNDRLLPGTQEAIFRLVQEAFANIAKHARARNIALKVFLDEQRLNIEVRDDGQGFDTTRAPVGMGLKNLRERAQELHGSIQIQSQPGQGTDISISIPLLDALRSSEEEAREKYELERAGIQARSGYQLCTNLSSLTIVLVCLTNFVPLPWIVIALAGLAAAYGYSSGVYARVQATLRSGPESLTALALKNNDYAARRAFTTMLGFCLWFSVSQIRLLASDFGWLVLFILLVCLISFNLFDRRGRYQHSEIYYNLLPLHELRWELEGRRQALDRSLRVWAFGSLCVVLFVHSLLVFPPTTPNQWFTYGIFVVILMTVLSVIFERLQNQRWKQTLYQRTQQADAKEA
jgi:signal transduction histidine kinase